MAMPDTESTEGVSSTEEASIDVPAQGCVLKRRMSKLAHSRIFIVALCLAVILVLVAVISCAVHDASGVEIDESNFPDATFRAYVASFDTNGNGRLSDDEVAKVVTIDISRDAAEAEDMAIADDSEEEETSASPSVGTILDVTGIQTFTKLRIFDAENNDISTSTDLSMLSELEQCNVSGNTHLPEIFLSDNFNEKKLDIDDNIMYGIGLKRVMRVTYSFVTQSASESTFEFENTGEQPAFTYPVVGSDGQSKTFSALNDSWKTIVDEAAASEYVEDSSSTTDDAYRYCNCTVSYFKNGVISIRKNQCTTLGGSHDSITVTGSIENVKTGSTITPEETLGISKGELDSKTVAAVEQYLAANPNTSYWSGKITSAIESLKTYLTEGKISYYATSDGIVACIPTYCLGDSNAGHPEIFVASFDESTSSHKPGDRLEAVEGIGSSTEGVMTVGVRQ